MGADLYIQPDYNNNFDKWKPKFDEAICERNKYPHGSQEYKLLQLQVDLMFKNMNSVGYFRDNYNSYGLFAQLGLSWWRDVIPLCNSRGNLTRPRAQKLLKMVQGAALCTASAQKVAQEQGDKTPDKGWDAHYEKFRQELLAFLQDAIDRNVPIECSL